MYAAALTGGLIGAEAGVVAGPPGIALGAIVGIIGAAIGALGSSYLFTLSAQWHTAPLYDQLLAALYAANSADEGTEAFYAVINASEVLNLPFKPLLNALWWNDWSNEVYGALPVVDDSAFDGTICVPDLGDITDCTIFSSQAYSGTYGTFQVVISPPIYSGNDIFTAGNFNGYSMRLVTFGGGTGIRCDWYDTSGGYHAGGVLVAVDEVLFYPSDTAAIGCHTDAPNEGLPFTVELCPPV